MQTVYTQAFGIAVFAIQAPLLPPRAFGLMAIVMVFVSLFEATVDSAIEALISIEAIETAHYATVNALALGAGGVVFILLQLAATPLAGWFEEPQLEPVTRVLAILPLVSALGTVPTAAAKRAVAFRPLAIRMICGVTAGGAVGVSLVLLGYGVWSLVAQLLVQRGVCTAVLWACTPLSMSVNVSRRHWHELIAFARPLVLSKSLIWANSQLPRFVLALHLSVADLGLFALANRLTDMVTSVTVVPKTAVARVQLRQLARSPGELAEATAQLMFQLGTYCFPLCVIGVALLPLQIHAWLRPQWFGAIVPAQWLLLSAAASVTFYSATAVLLATQQQRAEATISILQVLTIVLATGAFGAKGLMLVAIALAVRAFLLVIPVAILVRRRSGIAYRAFLGPQLVPLIVAVAVAIPVGLVSGVAEVRLGSLLAVVSLGVLAVLVYGWVMRTVSVHLRCN